MTEVIFKWLCIVLAVAWITKETQPTLSRLLEMTGCIGCMYVTTFVMLRDGRRR